MPAALSRFAPCAALLLIAACGRSPTIRDPIAGVALVRQRNISRTDVGFRWPLSVGVGTLACDEAGTILFRSRGITYVLSERRAETHGIEALQILEPTPPPSNPLRRLKQADREEAFRQVTRCDSRENERDACRRAALHRLGLSEPEWNQINVEGHERRWPPLSREPMSLDPLIAAGRALCQSAAGR